MYREDRPDGFGGVFIACHHKLISSHLIINENSGNQLVAAQLKLSNNTSIIICAAYHPPRPDGLALSNLCSSLGKIIQDNL